MTATTLSFIQPTQLIRISLAVWLPARSIHWRRLGGGEGEGGVYALPLIAAGRVLNAPRGVGGLGIAAVGDCYPYRDGII